ncbi:hypothetical protein [Porphyrobacter sp. YT40]|uniref:hypothetical protein n=1 Tax=Porphyrobacter sp. YT40 TaxID=2547601 RepID=UPI0011442CF7|nr:hypothetical protein [Porphyrobacter sp. YT40]QDH35217.1 hypothetical protein E2E27_13350 [Porphyrobacter sp. YT40]
MIYKTPALSKLDITQGKNAFDLGEGRYSVSISCILGAVQSAYSDAGFQSSEVVDIKSQLFDLAARGEIEKLIYHAILDTKKRVEEKA